MEHLLQIGFVVENLVEIRTQDTPEEFGLSGRVRCLHGLFVDVDKVLAVRIQRGRRMVRTVEYSYHVGIEGKRNRPIFRYDNAHPYPGHPDAHHKHRFDPVSGRRIEPPDWVGEAGWPHLSDIIDELQEWWTTTGRFLAPPLDDEQS